MEYHKFIETEEFSNETELCRLLKKFNSDKCSNWHNYSALYHNLFKKLKNKTINIFEVGIYEGASVRAWSEYFAKGSIYAGDVDLTRLINEDRIKSFYCNQDSINSIQNMWALPELKDIDFDIIIDDGKHEYPSNINFLLSSYFKLKKNGFFIVEDLTTSTYNEFEKNYYDLVNKLNPSYMKLIKLQNNVNFIDNNILLIQK
jgi:hypothetical protein